MKKNILRIIAKHFYVEINDSLERWNGIENDMTKVGNIL